MDLKNNSRNGFKKILDEMYVTFCKKQRNYGPGNISVGSNLETEDDKKIALTGLWFRKNDKIQRLLQLVVKGQPDEVGENIQDTYEDLSVYGIISQIVQIGIQNERVLYILNLIGYWPTVFPKTILNFKISTISPDFCQAFTFR